MGGSIEYPTPTLILSGDASITDLNFNLTSLLTAIVFIYATILSPT